MTPLEAAHDAVVRRDFAGAIEAAVAAYGACRASSIAAVVVGIARQLPERTPIKTRRGADKWRRIEAEGRAADVDLLIVSARACGGLLGLAARPVDPRIARELEREIHGLPHRAPSAKPYYDGVFAALERIGDPESAASLRAARATLTALGVPTFRAWMEARLDAAVAALDALPVATSSELETIARIEAALATGEAARGANLDELYAEVYANPDDDGARMVLADRLQEAGDARGELIVLQMKAELVRKERARVNAIIRERREQLLGPIAPWVLADGLVFERGFAARGKIRNGLHTPSSPGEAHEWSTFVALDVREDQSAVNLLGTSLRSLRRIDGAPYKLLGTLLKLTAPTRLVHLGFDDRIDTALEANRLAKLVAMIAPGKPLAAVTTLALTIGYHDRERFAELLIPEVVRAAIPVLRFEPYTTDLADALLARDYAAEAVEIAFFDGWIAARRGPDGARTWHGELPHERYAGVRAWMAAKL